MPVIGFNLSIEAIAYIDTIPGRNRSRRLETIIKAHEYIAPRLQKAKALEELRGSAAALADLGFSLEAIQAYVVTAIGEVRSVPVDGD